MSISFLSTQGTGGSAINYIRDSVSSMNRGDLDVDAATRNRRYKEHWNFYLGVQWNIDRENGQLVMANYCRAIVDKKASWLVGKGAVMQVPTPLQQVTKPIIERVWKENLGKIRLMEMAKLGGITGDVDIIISSEEPTAQEKKLNPRALGKTKIRIIDPSRVYPEWDPLNADRLVAVTIATEVEKTVTDQRPTNPTPLMRAGRSVRRTFRYIERITADTISEGYEGQAPTVRPNSLGEIPHVHIPNEIVPGEFYGLSDLDGIIDLQRELNEKMTDVSDIVHYHAAPITIISGAKAKQLEKSAKAMWSGLPSDAKVYNLELGSDLPASHNYVDKIRQMMFDISGLPEGSLGRLQNISNTSAAALEVQFQPLIEATARKTPNYEAGLEKVNYFILRIEQLRSKIAFPTDLCRNCGGRIVRFAVKGKDGTDRIKQKCYKVDPQTLDFMDPEDVKVSVAVEHSFGKEVRKMPFRVAKLMHGKTAPSFWDLAPMHDKEEKAEAAKEKQEANAENAKVASQENADTEHQRTLEQIEAKKKEATPPVGDEE